MKKKQPLPQIFWIGKNDPFQAFLKHYFISFDLEIYKVIDAGEEFNLSEAGRADIIMLDVNDIRLGFKECEGIEMIKELFPGKKIIAVSDHYDSAILAKAIDLGAQGYIFRHCVNKKIIDCVKSVLNGQTSYMVQNQPPDVNIIAAYFGTD